MKVQSYRKRIDGYFRRGAGATGRRSAGAYYIHCVQTFIGAHEVLELIKLRDERGQLMKVIQDLTADKPTAAKAS